MGINNGDPADYRFGAQCTIPWGARILCSATNNSNLNVDETGDMPTNCTSPYLELLHPIMDLRAGSGYGKPR